MSYGHAMNETGTCCSRCLRTATQIARSRRWCPGVPWYVAGSAPGHLYTRLQLKNRGLRPGKDQLRAGIVVTAYGDEIDLYDIAGARPRRGETEKQRVARLATWEKTREKWCCQQCNQVPASIGDLVNYWYKPGLCEACKEHIEWQCQEAKLAAKLERDHREVREWATLLLADPKSWAVVDTETSELNGVIVEIAIIDATGTVLFESLVNPDGEPIAPSARAIHGLTDDELAEAPRLSEIWPRIVEALTGRTTLIAYNSFFDETHLLKAARRYHLLFVYNKVVDSRVLFDVHKQIFQAK